MKAVIIGIGHDICDQRRIYRLLTRFGPAFCARILSREEQVEYEQRGDKTAYVAGRFAVKEAVYKALSSTDQRHMYWHHAVTASQKSGAPQLELKGQCLKGALSLVPPGKQLRTFVSISDEKPYSSAFVVLSAQD